MKRSRFAWLRGIPRHRGRRAGNPALSFAVAALLSVATLPLTGQDLPRGKGADLVAAKCLPCHAPEVVTNSAGINRATWIQVMRDMEALGMEVTPGEYDTIVDYLATYLGPNPPQPGEVESEVTTAAKPIDAAELYKQTCSVCHGRDGRGIKGQFPSLAGNPYLAKDPRYGALVILYGLEGEIRVDRETLRGLMPGFPQLDDSQIATLANYTLEAWNQPAASAGNFRQITAEVVRQLRKKPLTPREVLALRPQID